MTRDSAVGIVPVILKFIEFDETGFNDDMFAVHEIAFPPEIRRGVLRRRCEYFHGRLAARHVLRSIEVDDCDILNDASRAPSFPEGVVGSISHTHGIAAAAAAPQSGRNGLGLDVERIVDNDTLIAIAASALSASERDMARAGPLPFNVAVTLIFSAKESFYKAVSRHAGRMLPFSAIDLTALDPLARRLRFVVTERICPLLAADTVVDIAYACHDDAIIYTLFEW